MCPRTEKWLTLDGLAQEGQQTLFLTLTLLHLLDSEDEDCDQLRASSNGDIPE